MKLLQRNNVLLWMDLLQSCLIVFVLVVDNNSMSFTTSALLSSTRSTTRRLFHNTNHHLYISSNNHYVKLLSRRSRSSSGSFREDNHSIVGMLLKSNAVPMDQDQQQQQQQQQRVTYQAPSDEILKRRNLAIISHPDSGKTTMTEKLLLYGGALQQAGAVRQKAEQRATTSDFMEMEKERGISISATVMNFDYDDHRINILDTPGHQDFSEDTYRALAAADNAVMLLDAAKGLEPQTRKLFEVTRMRMLPLFTFVNKMDRPAISPYEIMDQIESEFGLETHPITWPIGDGERFKGVVDRLTGIVHLYEKSAKRGGKAEVVQVPIENRDQLIELIDDSELSEKLFEDIELLEELMNPLDIERVLAADQSPLFFGSAMTNFGVQLFLDKFLGMGTKPVGRNALVGKTPKSMEENLVR